jgi:mono/diheme cytochrome c family protein
MIHGNRVGNRTLPRIYGIALAALLVLGIQEMAQARTPAIDGPQPRHDATRGQLLYSTHCIACHGAQMHWRDKRLAVDRPSLLGQVRRWAQMSGLAWGEAEMADVAQYLNEAFYHYPDIPNPSVGK